METTRVLIADPNTLVRSLLHVAVTTDDTTPDGEVADGQSLLLQWRRTRPAVVVTNTDLADGPADRVVSAMCSEGARVLVLTLDRCVERVTAMLAGGVSGYLVRDDTDLHHVPEAVRAVAAGEVVLHSCIAPPSSASGVGLPRGWTSNAAPSPTTIASDRLRCGS